MLLSDSEALQANIDAAFKNWADIRDEPSLYTRILISIIAISHSQGNGDEGIDEYIRSLPSETRAALASRAQQIFDSYKSHFAASMKQDTIQATWMDAVAWGLKVHFDDFARAQTQSLIDLSNVIEKRTNFMEQVKVAFFVTFLVAASVGIVRISVTALDDITPQHKQISTIVSKTNKNP